MKRVLLGMVLMVGACAQAQESGTADEQMAAGLWSEVFQGPSATPHVLWVEGDRLNCDGGHGERSGWMKAERCRDGYTIFLGLVEIARWDGMASLAESALSHEFAHNLDLALGGDGDPDHAGPAFAPGGLVELGEAWLARYETTPRPAP